MRRRGAQSGFTLMEMMVVVVIIGVLAAVGINAYKKWIKKSKSAEVQHIMLHLQQRELAYQAQEGNFLATGADDDDTFPALADLKGGDFVSISDLGGAPAEWQTLKVQPGGDGLYCGYVVLSGTSAETPDGDALTRLWNDTAPTRPWFYVVAQCDWDNDQTDYEKWMLRGDLGWNAVVQLNAGD